MSDVATAQTEAAPPAKTDRTFRRSESIAKLAEALAAAQGEITHARKDQNNTYFQSKYADLAGVIDCCRVPLSKNGLAVLQFPRVGSAAVEVETVLSHSSGEWVAETLRLPLAKPDAQGVGTAITYARRYALAAIVGVASEDDDGNAAAKAQRDAKEEILAQLKLAAGEGTARLETTWKQTLTSTQRKLVSDAELASLKTKAKDADKRQEANHAAATA